MRIRIIMAMISLGGFLLLMNSCYYDKEDLLYSGLNNGPCTDSTGTVSYSQKVAPLLRQYCYSCHSGSFPAANQLMGAYTSDKIMAQNGKLYGTISHSPNYSPMPQGMAKMSNCQIATIKKWIDGGTPDN